MLDFFKICQEQGLDGDTIFMALGKANVGRPLTADEGAAVSDCVELLERIVRGCTFDGELAKAFGRASKYVH